MVAVAESHTGLNCGKIIGEYIEKLIDLGHPPKRVEKMMTYLMGAFSVVPIATKNAPHPHQMGTTRYLCFARSMVALIASFRMMGALLALKPYYAGFTIGGSAEVCEALGE